MRYFFIVVLTGCFMTSKAQRNFDFAAGIGGLEMWHVAARYQLKQFKSGMSIGTYFIHRTNDIGLSADVYYHFAGKSKYTEVRPWYGRVGLHYQRYEDEYSKLQEYWLQYTIGRDFNLSKKFGIALDLGMSKRISQKEEIKKPRNTWDLFDFSSWPGGSLQVYYRLK